MADSEFLINNTYSLDQGKELLLNLVNQKIDFINRELFLDFLYNNRKSKALEKRVIELKALKQKIIDDFTVNDAKQVQVKASFEYQFEPNSISSELENIKN